MYIGTGGVIDSMAILYISQKTLETRIKQHNS